MASSASCCSHAGAFWRDPAFFLTVTAYSIFFFYKMRIVPEHFWSTRRFLAATLPGLILGLGGLAALLLSSGITRETPATGNADGHSRSRRGPPDFSDQPAVCLLFAALGAMFWRAAAPVRAHVEYAGLIPRLEALAARFGDRDLLLVESRNASDVHVLALPLAYIYDRHVLVLNSPRPAKPEFAAFMTWAQTNYANVFYLGGGGTISYGIIGGGTCGERALPDSRIRGAGRHLPNGCPAQGVRLWRLSPRTGVPGRSRTDNPADWDPGRSAGDSVSRQRTARRRRTVPLEQKPVCTCFCQIWAATRAKSRSG